MGHFNATLLSIDHDKKNQQKTSELDYTIDQMLLTDICRIFHPTTFEYIFFSSIHVKLSPKYIYIDHILGHKASLNIHFKTEIISYNITDHNGIKLENNNKKTYRNSTNTWRLNNPLLKDQLFTEEIRKEI
jgi:hypothetical protein